MLRLSTSLRHFPVTTGRYSKIKSNQQRSERHSFHHSYWTRPRQHPIHQIWLILVIDAYEKWTTLVSSTTPVLPGSQVQLPSHNTKESMALIYSNKAFFNWFDAHKSLIARFRDFGGIGGVATLVALVAWLSGNALVSINVVTLCRARLVLGWVTVCERVSYLGK